MHADFGVLDSVGESAIGNIFLKVSKNVPVLWMHAM
jgi:hypothetical protein